MDLSAWLKPLQQINHLTENKETNGDWKVDAEGEK